MAMRLRIRELIHEKSLREGRQITQKEVALESGIDESMLSRYANGFTTSFKGDVIESLLDYFDVALDELFHRETDIAQN
ncbi:MAG: helix-turn-helix transcriptional regulator [Chloroflexota bacterium]